MGMSASQCRLLTLTARLSDLEYSAQSISNSKIRLADQAEDAATTYSEALNLEKLTVYDADTSSYMDATAYNLTTYGAVSNLDKQRFLTNNAGQILVMEKVGRAYENALTAASTLQGNMAPPNAPNVNSLEEYLSYQMLQRPDTATLKQGDKGYEEWTNYYSNLWNGTEQFLNSMGYTSNEMDPADDLTYDASAVKSYTNMYNEIKDKGYYAPGDQQMNDGQWLEDGLRNGSIYLETWDREGGEDGTGDFEEVSWESGDATLRTVDDESGIAKAQAEYDVALAKIKSKDSKFDLELKQIDTEHTAIQTEIDSVKKVINKNIERSFKVFDA
jgi:hypothetical protein